MCCRIWSPYSTKNYSWRRLQKAKSLSQKAIIRSIFDIDPSVHSGLPSKPSVSVRMQPHPPLVMTAKNMYYLSSRAFISDQKHPHPPLVTAAADNYSLPGESFISIQSQPQPTLVMAEADNSSLPSKSLKTIAAQLELEISYERESLSRSQQWHAATVHSYVNDSRQSDPSRGLIEVPSLKFLCAEERLLSIADTRVSLFPNTADKLSNAISSQT